MSSRGDGMRIRDRDKFGLELGKNRLPGALDRALKMDGLNAQHGKRAASRKETSSTRTPGAIEMLAQSAAQPGTFAAGDFLGGDEIAMENVFGFSVKDVGEAAGH